MHITFDICEVLKNEKEYREKKTSEKFTVCTYPTGILMMPTRFDDYHPRLFLSFYKRFSVVFSSYLDLS
jgi:hypothetical protein